DLLEGGIADDNYGTLTRFPAEESDYLNPGGRILRFLGTSGGIVHLYSLLDQSKLAREVIASRDLNKEEVTVTYYTFRLVPCRAVRSCGARASPQADGGPACGTRPGGNPASAARRHGRTSGASTTLGPVATH